MLLLDDDSDKRELKKIVDVANAPTRGPSVISSLFLLYGFKKCVTFILMILASVC